jgi:hypothetical protein
MTPVLRQGDFPLASVAGLPNVDIAFPGEHWSNRKAQGQIVPGSAVVPVNVGGKLYMRVATGTDPITQMAIALRTIDVPDINTGPTALGPNEIVNQAINAGEYVHAYYSGVFHCTLVVPRAWVPGELVGWNPAGARPTGKAGSGAWDVDGAAAADPLFEVMEFREVNAAHEGILTMKSLRGQF